MIVRRRIKRLLEWKWSYDERSGQITLTAPKSLQRVDSMSVSQSQSASLQETKTHSKYTIWQPELW